MKIPYEGSQLRAHTQADVMGGTLTNYWKTLGKKDRDYYYLYTNEWLASTRLNAATNQNFSSWKEFFGKQQSTTPVYIPFDQEKKC